MRLLTLLFALAIAAPANAAGGELRLRVNQDANGDFTVLFNSRARLTDYWCAAGRFVTVNLAMPDQTRVYRASAPPRKSGQGIAFTLDASQSAGATGLSTFGGPQDGSMSAGGAFAEFCFGFHVDDF